MNIGQKLTVFSNTTFNANVTMPGSVTDNQIFYDYTLDDLNLKQDLLALVQQAQAHLI